MMTALQALTPRELEILNLLCDGRTTDKELAAHLGIAAATVLVHITSIFKKFAVHNRVELVVKVYKERIARYETAT